MKRVVNRSACRGPGPWALPACLGMTPMRFQLPLFLLATVLCAEVTAAERSVSEQLERMVSALRSLSYEGTLVYLHDSHLETIRIVRRIENGKVHEHMESLNGPVRTVTRDQNRVTCNLPDSHPISVRRQGLGGDLLRSKSIDPEVLSPHYLVHPLGTARVAGRQTDVVGIIPRDRLRYGYRFYLDRDIGLPLKSDLIGGDAEPIEQIMFTSLTLHPSQEQEVTPAADLAEPFEKRTSLPGDARSWRFDPLPEGFELVMYDSGSEAEDRQVEHFVLSDGLASVSVYIESGEQEGLQGGSRIGAIHAVGGQVAGHQITVVGEVPADTVDAVLASVSRVDGDTP